MNNETAPKCHFKEMEYEAGDSDDTGIYEEWFICSHCGCVKDIDGAVIKDE